MRKLLTAALTAAFVLPAGIALADPAEDVVNARLGYYRLLGLEMGGLAAMAKGEKPYDAEAAKGHAANLQALISYSPAGLFAPGTSNADMPGKTRALPAIWENFPKVGEKGAAFREAVGELAAVAGDGLEALQPAVGKLGGTCKSCHDDFRATDY
jgi:cytochrome c556